MASQPPFPLPPNSRAISLLHCQQVALHFSPGYTVHTEPQRRADPKEHDLAYLRFTDQDVKRLPRCLESGELPGPVLCGWDSCSGDGAILNASGPLATSGFLVGELETVTVIHLGLG